MTRVQMPAYTYRWMMGDRYGEIVKVTRKWGHVPNGTGGLTAVRNGQEIAHVKLDISGKVVRVLFDDCTVV